MDHLLHRRDFAKEGISLVFGPGDDPRFKKAFVAHRNIQLEAEMLRAPGETGLLRRNLEALQKFDRETARQLAAGEIIIREWPGNAGTRVKEEAFSAGIKGDNNIGNGFKKSRLANFHFVEQGEEFGGI